MDNKKPQRIEKMFEKMYDSATEGMMTTEEVSAMFESVLKMLKEYRVNIESNIDEKTKKVVYYIDELESKLKAKINTSEREYVARLREFSDECRKEMMRIESLIPDMPDMPAMPSMPDLTAIYDRIEKLESPEVEITGEKIVEKINDLPIESEYQIDAKHIKNLPKNDGKGQVIYTGGGGSGGRIVKAYDLSASLDGSTKTFVLPAFWRIVSVHLSSFPNILRPTTDFTTSGTSITFTSEINETTSLAAGQTLLVIYAEN